MRTKIIKQGSEAEIQQSIAKYLDFKGCLWCASAGGVRTSLSQAVRMKKTGYKKGFPDVFIYEPRRGFHGLAIEIKKQGGQSTPEQRMWITDLDKRGYKALICKGIDECIKAIDEYFA